MSVNRYTFVVEETKDLFEKVKSLQEALKSVAEIELFTDSGRSCLAIEIDTDKLKRGAGRKPKIDSVTYGEIMDMHAAGMTHEQIAKKIGWSRASYYRAWKERNVHSPEEPFWYGKYLN